MWKWLFGEKEKLKIYHKIKKENYAKLTPVEVPGMRSSVKKTTAHQEASALHPDSL